MWYRLACISMHEQVSVHVCACQSRSWCLHTSCSSPSLLRQGLSLDRELAGCLDYLVRKAQRSRQFPSAGGHVHVAMPDSLHGCVELFTRMCRTRTQGLVFVQQALYCPSRLPGHQVFTFMTGCNHKILKQLLWREWIQTSRSNNIYAAYPVALVLLLKYKIMLCLQPLSHLCICTTWLYISIHVLATNTNDLKCSSVHFRTLLLLGIFPNTSFLTTQKFPVKPNQNKPN